MISVEALESLCEKYNMAMDSTEKGRLWKQIQEASPMDKDAADIFDAFRMSLEAPTESNPLDPARFTYTPTKSCVEGYAGFQNRGNNCWVNSLLQLIAHTPSLRWIAAQQAELSEALAIHDDAVSKGRAIQDGVSQKVRQKIHQLSFGSLAERGEQEDAYEALCLILNSCPQNSPLSFSVETSREFEPVVGSAVEKLDGDYSELKSGNVSSRSDPEHHLALDLKGDSLQEAIQFNLSSSPVAAEEGEKNLATYRISDTQIQKFRPVREERNLQTVPKELLVTLKRYERDWRLGGRIYKDATPITINPVLDLQNGNYFQLTGLIAHQGDLNQGHYVTYLVREDGQVVLCNDDSVRLVSQKEWHDVLFGFSHFTPYVLHYAPVPPETAKRQIDQFQEMEKKHVMTKIPPEPLSILEEINTREQLIEELTRFIEYVKNADVLPEEKEAHWKKLCTAWPEICSMKEALSVYHETPIRLDQVLQKERHLLGPNEDSLLEQFLYCSQLVMQIKKEMRKCYLLDWLLQNQSTPAIRKYVAKELNEPTLLSATAIEIQQLQSHISRSLKKLKREMFELRIKTLIHLLQEIPNQGAYNKPALLQHIRTNLFLNPLEFPFLATIQEATGKPFFNAFEENPRILIECPVQGETKNLLEEWLSLREVSMDELLEGLKGPSKEEVLQTFLQSQDPNAVMSLYSAVYLDRSLRGLPLQTMLTAEDVLEIRRPWFARGDLPLIEQLILFSKISSEQGQLHLEVQLPEISSIRKEEIRWRLQEIEDERKKRLSALLMDLPQTKKEEFATLAYHTINYFGLSEQFFTEYFTFLSKLDATESDNPLEAGKARFFRNPFELITLSSQDSDTETGSLLSDSEELFLDEAEFNALDVFESGLKRPWDDEADEASSKRRAL